MTNKYDDSDMFQAIVMFSVIVNTVFFFIMWRIKELQVHPMKLVMLVLVSDSCVLYTYSMSTYTCDLRL